MCANAARPTPVHRRVQKRAERELLGSKMCSPKSVSAKYQYQGNSKNTPTDTSQCANNRVGIMENRYSCPKIGMLRYLSVRADTIPKSVCKPIPIPIPESIRKKLKALEVQVCVREGGIDQERASERRCAFTLEFRQMHFYIGAT